MRKAIFYSLFFVICLPSFAQENTEKTRPYLSTEFIAIYPQYFTDYKEQFNYGAGVTISANFEKFSVAAGFVYTTKKYFESFDAQSSIDKINYSLNYFNVPVLVSFPLLKPLTRGNQLLLTTGFIFNIPQNYRSVTHFKNGSSLLNPTPSDYNSGSSLRLGFGFQRKLSSTFMFQAQLFTDYKIQLDNAEFINSNPQWRAVYADDRLMAGITIGLKWIYKAD